MPSLEAFQIPHDANSVHQLHWTPGQYGKGLFRNGELHHWPVDRVDGDPSHRRYIQEIMNEDLYSLRNHDDWGNLFWLYPDGKMGTLPNGKSWGDPRYKDALIKEIQAIDPRIAGMQEDWHFGGINQQQRALPELPEFEALRERQHQEDPDSEQHSDWDRYVGQGDTYTHPDVEWVPTHALKKFIEYDRRPGGQHATDPKRYEALKQHIKANGFNDPVILEYNQDTGTAHMGEGNHRTAIALELGLPAMPVRVYSGQRTSPTQIPVQIQHRPEWTDHLGEQHIPQSLKPSHIGLETVPPPGEGWQLS